MFTNGKHIERRGRGPDHHKSFISNWETPVVEVLTLDGCYEDRITGLIMACCVGAGAEGEF